MPHIPFKVSARTAKLIGMENFSNSEGAIIELVKNTYDADSPFCIVLFDLIYDQVIIDEIPTKLLNAELSSIYVIDNGEGMTDEIITNQWMTIGTDNKLEDFQSKGARIKTGAKGIGRFALNRLGNKTIVNTFSAETNKGYKWSVNWGDFDRTGANVSDIGAELTEIPDLQLDVELQPLAHELPKFEELICNGFGPTGTIIKITDLNDKWEDDQLDRLYNSLEILLPPKEQADFKIYLFSKDSPEKYGELKGAYYDDFDYKVDAKYFDDDDRTLEIKITRSELDVNELESKYGDFFNNFGAKSPFTLQEFRDKTITITTTLNKIFSVSVDEELIKNIGAFSFTFYYLKNAISDDKGEGDLKKYPYKPFNSSARRAWLKKFGGIKIFRDDFRIRPYGENGEDWLKLGERQAISPGGAGQKMGGYKIRPNQVAGAVNISRIANENFQDKSGREGIQENDTFELFKNLLKEIIGFFEVDRNAIMFNLSELHKKRNKEAEKLRLAKEAADRVNNATDSTSDQISGSNSNSNNSQNNAGSGTDSSDEPSQAEKNLAAGFKLLEEEIDDKNEEIRILRSFASVGLIISSFAHEVKSLRSRLQPRTIHLLKELSLHLSEESLSNLDKDDNPFYMIRLIQEEDTKLKHWLDYSLNSLKRDKRERTNINLRNYFDSFKATWNKAVEQRNAKIKLLGDSTQDVKVRGFEIDFDTIFNNLLSNSLNALKGISREKLIEIDWLINGENVEIIFSDNGKGLDLKYSTNPEMVFNLLESSKTDKKGEVIGTGLGLYIAKSVIEEYNNSGITIIGTSDCFKLKLNFPNRN